MTIAMWADMAQQGLRFASTYHSTECRPTYAALWWMCL